MLSAYHEQTPPPDERQGPDLPFRLWPFAVVPLACGVLALLFDLVRGLSEYNPLGTLLAHVLVAAFGGLLLASAYATVAFIYLLFFRR